MKKLSIMGLVLLLSLTLSACTTSEVTDDNLEASDVIAELLEEDPGSFCNTLSPSKVILLNKPCADELFSQEISIEGKIINSTESVIVNIKNGTEIIHTQEIFPLPSSAAGAYKLINETIRVEKPYIGKATLEIVQNDEIVIVPIELS